MCLHEAVNDGQAEPTGGPTVAGAGSAGRLATERDVEQPGKVGRGMPPQVSATDSQAWSSSRPASIRTVPSSGV